MSILEAWCLGCEQAFNPIDEQDLEHCAREDGEECGGFGVLLGEWGSRPVGKPVPELPVSRFPEPAGLEPSRGRWPTDEDVEAAIAQGKGEILADIAEGVVPADVPDFSALHDYVDANCYAGLCDEDLPVNWPVSAGEPGPDTAVQDTLDAWLRAGRPEAPVEVAAR